MKNLATFVVLTVVLFSTLFARAVPAQALTNMTVTVTTGEDDLRGGNCAFISMRLMSEVNTSEQSLACGAAGGSVTTSGVTFPETFRASDVRSITIRHDGSPRSGHPFDTYDNWNVNAVVVRLGGRILYDSDSDSGLGHRPLQRFTGAVRTLVLRISPIVLEPDLWTTGWCTLPGAIVHVGDFNGDGANDLLCRDASRMYIRYANHRGALVGTLDWSIATSWCTHASIRFFGLGDFNGDGRTDLLCKDATRIWINTADTEGHFSAAGDLPLDTVWCTHTGIRSFGLGDFNGDGRTDLMCKDATRIWTNRADTEGHFSAAGGPSYETAWCTHASIRFFGLGDFNGDGRTDLMCKDESQIWVNTADTEGHFSTASGGSYVDPTGWCTHTGITFPGLGDFNGDGRTDLMCKDATRIWTNIADTGGHFSAAGGPPDLTAWCPGATRDTLQLADLNGDRRTDLLCRDGRTMQIAYALASGGFSYR